MSVTELCGRSVWHGAEAGRAEPLRRERSGVSDVVGVMAAWLTRNGVVSDGRMSDTELCGRSVWQGAEAGRAEPLRRERERGVRRSRRDGGVSGTAGVVSDGRMSDTELCGRSVWHEAEAGRAEPKRRERERGVRRSRRDGGVADTQWRG
jgi:hypothetical protein